MSTTLGEFDAYASRHPPDICRCLSYRFHVSGNGFGSHESASVLQAQGMVGLQADCSMDEAMALMLDTAHHSDVSLDELASCVLDGTVRFDPS